MSYQQITINVNDAVAERLADALMEHGALSAAIEDAYAGTENEQAIFGEPGMPTEQIWQQSKVIALFGESDDAASIIEAAAQECGLNDLKYTGEILEDQDWVRLTQAQFDPIQISDRLWITVLARSAQRQRRQPATRPGSCLRHRQPSDHPPLPQMAGHATQRRRKRIGLRLRLRHFGHCRPQTRRRLRHRRRH